MKRLPRILKKALRIISSVATRFLQLLRWYRHTYFVRQTKLPPIDERVLSHFKFDHAEAPILCYPVNLDVKQIENLRCLLIDHTRVGLSDQSELGIPVFSPLAKDFEYLFCTGRPPVSIILDLHDRGRDCLELSPSVWRTIHTFKLQVIYLKLQISNPAAYVTLNKLPSQLHVLSIPMLLGGSRFHITTQDDFHGENLFRTTMRANHNPTYAYDWSWIGGATSPDRKAAQTIMQQVNRGHAHVTWTKIGHADAGQATVPFTQYVEIMRQSRIVLSLNGNGPWCLKDGETFVNHAFCLRQQHLALKLNPLSPQDGVHWATFRTEELGEAIQYYLDHPDERERIRDRGYEYFRTVLFDAFYAQYYAEHLCAFLQDHSKNAWGKLQIA